MRRRRRRIQELLKNQSSGPSDRIVLIHFLPLLPFPQTRLRFVLISLLPLPLMFPLRSESVIVLECPIVFSALGPGALGTLTRAWGPVSFQGGGNKRGVDVARGGKAG